MPVRPAVLGGQGCREKINPPPEGMDKWRHQVWPEPIAGHDPEVCPTIAPPGGTGRRGGLGLIFFFLFLFWVFYFFWLLNTLPDSYMRSRINSWFSCQSRPC